MMAQRARDKSAASDLARDVEAFLRDTFQNTNKLSGIPENEDTNTNTQSTADDRNRALHALSHLDKQLGRPNVPDINLLLDDDQFKPNHPETEGNIVSLLGRDIPGRSLPSSAVTFFSIDPVSDRGNAAHLNWEQSQLQTRDYHSPSGHSTSSLGSLTSPTPVEGATIESTGDVEDGDSIKNRICSALQRSAFNAKDYLPLDQLCKILSPSVVHQLLLQQFGPAKASEYEREILGTQKGVGALPARRRRIFALLVLIDQLKRLPKFIECGVDDTALPFHFTRVEPTRLVNVSYMPHHQDETCHEQGCPCQNPHGPDEPILKQFDVWPNHTAHDFTLWQPIIHVPFLKFPGDTIYFYDLGQDSTLPFLEYDLQQTGGYGSVHKATVHPSHYNSCRNSKVQQPVCFAIRKPHIPCLGDYLQEIEPFDKLGIEDNGPDLNHLIPLQLTFKHGRDYYLVFPWADGNLKQFWSQRSANPKDPDEVRWFMAQCSGITRGLRKLHHLSTQLSSQKAPNANPVNVIKGTEIIFGGEEWGRHGDIKPENILWFENYKGERDFLVISDFGLTQFNSAHSRSNVQIPGFSGTYRPPDLHLENQPISQNYDVWSLGCVFLEFLSWFLLGYQQAVDVFTQARLVDEPKGVIPEDTFFSIGDGPQATMRKAILKKSVVEWIDKLHKTPQCTEPFHSLLDLIQFTMLVPNPDGRWKSAWVDKELRRLKLKCQNEGFAMKAVSRGPDPNTYQSFLNPIAYAPRIRLTKGSREPKDIGPSGVGSVTDLSSADQWTDSGYGSFGRGTTAPTSVGNSTSKHQGNGFDFSQLSNHDEDDAVTVYSVAESVPEDELEGYKSELCEAIIHAIHPYVSDAGLLDSLTSVLPPLLQSFALRLGCPGSSKAEIEIMYFVHRYRNDIASQVDNGIKVTADKEDPNSSSTELQEDLSTSPTEQQKGSTARNVNQWLQGVDHSAVTEQHLLSTHNTSANLELSWPLETEELETRGEMEEQTPLPDKRGYRDVVLNSVAYTWLTAALVRALTMSPVGKNDVCADIRKEIHASLSQKRTFSSRSPSERHAMNFTVEWDLKLFLREQFPKESDLGRLFRRALTLTGSVTDAQALPCADYLLQTWPTTGSTILEVLEDALVTGNEVSRELQDKSLVSCLFDHSELRIKVEGTADTIATVAEQIIWLGASLRQSCSESGLATCRPRIQTSGPTITGAPTKCRVEFSVEEHKRDSQESSDGQCWHEIFQNPVVVEGYPIPRRAQYGSGLEIPLNVMAGLTGCPRINQYMGHHFLKGFSTALVPTGKMDDTILWHLYYTEEGSRLPYPDMGSMDKVDIGFGGLTQARHIVGWCSKAQFFVGTAGMNYDIKPSQLDRPGKEFSLEKATISVGQIVTGGCQFALGRKDPHVRITRGSYKAKLEWLDSKYVTLWDVDEERGWLVNGNSALLHLLRASLKFSKENKFNSEFLFQENRFEESPSPLTPDSTLHVLLNPRNQRLKLYLKDSHSYTETKELPSGDTETITKTVTSWTTVRDRIEELYETMEKLIDHNATSEDSYKGVNMKPRRHDHLNGWDFADIARDQDPFYLRKANLPLDWMSWVELTKAIPAITLFGKGFGDMILASPQETGCCRDWRSVPTSRHLLCVSVADLRAIIKQIGNEGTNPITVAPGILWRNQSGDSPFHTTCHCATKCEVMKEKTHHCIQELASAKTHALSSMANSAFNKLGFSSSGSMVDIHLTDHDNGAVIFGRRAEWRPSRGTSATTESPNPEPSQIRTLGHSSTSYGPNIADSLTPSLPATLNSSQALGHNNPATDSIIFGETQVLGSTTIGGELDCHSQTPDSPQVTGLGQNDPPSQVSGSLVRESSKPKRMPLMRKVAESIAKKWRERKSEDP